MGYSADQFSGFLKDKKWLIYDQDPLFTEGFREILKASGLKPIRTPPMSPHTRSIVILSDRARAWTMRPSSRHRKAREKSFARGRFTDS